MTAFSSTMNNSQEEISTDIFYRLENVPETELFQNLDNKIKLNSFTSEKKGRKGNKMKNRDLWFETGPLSKTVEKIKDTGNDLKEAIIGDNEFLNKTAHNAFALYKRVSFSRRRDGIDNKMDNTDKIDQINEPKSFFEGGKKGDGDSKGDKERGIYYNLNW